MPEPIGSHGMRYQALLQYEGGVTGYEPLFITQEMIAEATEAIVAAHDEELKAFLRGEVEANAWRPQKYAEAALRAALASRETDQPKET